METKQKLKESENDAVVNVHCDYFRDLFGDESPQNKANCAEEEKEEAEVQRLKRPSGQVAV